MTHGQKRNDDISLITKLELCRMLSVSEASVDRWLRTDPGFPQPRRLGPGSIRWIRQEVNLFIQSLVPVAYENHAFDPADASCRTARGVLSRTPSASPLALSLRRSFGSGDRRR